MIIKEFFVNGRFLSQKPTGVQKFALGLCHELHSLGHSVTFICPKGHLNSPGFGKVIQTGISKGHLWEQVDLVLFVKSHKIKNLINLSNSAPIFLNGNIVTIHDLAFLANPKWYSKSYRTLYNFLTPIIVQKAHTILTVSKFSKKEILNAYDVPSSKIKVINQGIYYNQKDSTESFSLPDKYFLYVGSLDPRKRLSFLIKSFINLNSDNVKLIVVGGTNKIFGKEDLNTSKNIIWVPAASDSQLKYYYKNALATILPSEYEGFGRPILESLYFGTEVICSDIPVFKEHFYNHVHFFKLNDNDNLTLLMAQILEKRIIKLSPHCPSEMFSYTFASNTLIKSLY